MAGGQWELAEQADVTVSEDSENWRIKRYGRSSVFWAGWSRRAVCKTKGVLEFLYQGPLHAEA